MFSIRSSALYVLVFALVNIVGIASAQEPSDDDERARVHFQAGRSYFEEGSYEQALQEFSRAYDLSQRAVLLVNIANVQERLGQWDGAAASLERFVATLPANDPQVSTLRRRITNLRERQVAQGHPSPSTTTTGNTTNTTGGTTATPTGGGSHDDATTTTPGAQSDSGSSGLLVPSLIGFGVGAIGLVSFSVFGALALAEESTIADGCGANASCAPEQVAPMDDLALAADISLAIGLLGAAAGVVLILVGPPSSGDSESASARLVPYGGRHGGGVAITGTF